jgi:ribosome-associated protein
MHFKPPYLLSEFVFKTSRSGGKGGQNVNKVATKVQIDFAIADSQLLTETEKEVLLQKLAGKLNKSGVLQIIAQEDRTQLGNKEIALTKIYRVLNNCFVVRKKRKATKPHQASIESRLATKKRDASVKVQRSNRNWE